MITDIENIIFTDIYEVSRVIPIINPLKISVEIGSGNGHFIVSLALDKSDCLIIGCDLKMDRLIKTAQKISRNEIKNVLLYRGRGEELLTSFPDSSINAIYVNFPDPWPKKRHRKRRFFNEETISLIYNKLESGGILYFVTDHKEYFLSVVDLFKSSKLIPLFDNYYTINFEGYYKTLYFEKFKKEGKDIYFSFMKKL